MTKKKSSSQLDLLIEYFKGNPDREISHPEIVDWATIEWKKRTGKVFRDPDRGIRSLHQQGYLIKIKKGVYCYNSKKVKKKELENFTPKQKKGILKRDRYRCVICGKGEKEGVELHVDHIKPKDLGGKATIENGQTLCAQHNFLKKNFKQTETGKKMFIKLYNLSLKEQKEQNQVLKDFCNDILQIYEKHNINAHIKWKN